MHNNPLRCIVLDPGLSAPGGHHFEFARLLCSQFAGLRKLTFYGHASAGPVAAATLNVQPIFRDNVYPPDMGASFAQCYRHMTQSMVSDLAAVDAAELHADTIAVSHTTAIFQLGALAQWYAALIASSRPKLFIQFQHPIEWMVEPPSEWPQAIDLAKDAASALRAAGVVRFAANSEALANRVSAQLGQACALIPVPVRWPDLAGISKPERGIVFGFFGGLRREKGAMLLAPAIASFSARYPDARFIVHAPPGSDSEAVRSLKSVPQVRLIRRTFTRKSDYFSCLRRARWILLPYDPALYAIRTSGIFIESLGLGIPVVTTKGTWMAGELRARGGRGLIMPEYSAPALGDCLVEARLAMLADEEPPMPDREVIAYYSADNFCTSIRRLMSR